MLKDRIAEQLEIAFSRHGFAESSVAQLKTACNVSLRTLYKHYPSKEHMIVAALNHRHQRYFTFLTENAPAPGKNAIFHIFKRLEQWMHDYAPNGCMSASAISAYPDNPLITQTVKNHKNDVKTFLTEMSNGELNSSEISSLHDHRGAALFLLHEGLSSAWPLFGAETLATTLNLVTNILQEQAQ